VQIQKSISGTADVFDLKVEVRNYYCSEVLIQPITIYVPTGDFITGGGYIKTTSSAGTYASTNGTKTNFGFNVKYNKSGKNLQGKLNFIWRSGGKLYQAKSTATDALGVNISNPAAKTASFTSKCNIADITDPDNPINLGGNKLMHVTMVDKGEPGNNDEIGFTLWSGNELLYSSKWTGTSTLKTLLGGGNLVVHNGFNSGTVSARGIEPELPNITVDELTIRVLGNPSPTYFMLVADSKSDEVITMKVTDLNGKVLDIRRNIKSGDFIQIGDKFAVGNYFAEFIQGKQRVVVKLIKQ
jgi:hypothetical protein